MASTTSHIADTLRLLSRRDTDASDSSTELPPSRECGSGENSCYWVGKQYFEDLFKHELYGDMPPIAYYDSKLFAMMASYSYGTQLAVLRAKLDRMDASGVGVHDEDARYALLILIGLVCTTGSVYERTSLKMALRESIHRPRLEVPHTFQDARKRHLPAEFGNRSQSDLSQLDRLPWYTSALKLRSDQHGTPQPDYTDLERFGPLFEVRLRYVGQEWTGRATTKKCAKHRASQLACNALGMLVNTNPC